MECWSEISDFPDYLVSDHGRIYSKRRARVLALGKTSSGYAQAKFWVNGQAYYISVHRLVAITFLGNRPGMEVNHKDGIKTHNHVSNLEWSTRSNNMRHAHRTGLKKPSAGPYKIRRVMVVETGEIFENATECAKALGMDHSSISRRLSKNIINHRKGLSVKYVDGGDTS